MKPLDEAEKLARLRLARTENVGPVTFHHLLARFGTATHALEALPSLAAKGGLKRILSVPPASRIREEVDSYAHHTAHMIFHGEKSYPALLAGLPDAPPVLLVQGDAAWLHKPCVAFVGARNASLNGRKLAEKLAREVGQAGWVVVSGLAAGIDGAVHQGALETGTVGVIASGFDTVYPPEHRNLYAALRQKGAILTEMPPGTPITPQLFPRRNRLIAGLARGTVVVEAALKSGSLITARLAAEQGREVMAVPGSPADPRSGGTNRLIKEGATLVENAEDILAVLNATAPAHTPSLKEGDPSVYTAPALDIVDENSVDTARSRVVEALSPAPTPVDDVIRLCHVPSPVVWIILLEMELAGRLVRLPGNQVALVAPETGRETDG